MLCCIFPVFPVCHRAIIIVVVVIVVVPRSLNENELAEFVRSVLPFQSSARDDSTTLLERERGLTESEMGGNERANWKSVCVYRWSTQPCDRIFSPYQHGRRWPKFEGSVPMSCVEWAWYAAGGWNQMLLRSICTILHANPKIV